MHAFLTFTLKAYESCSSRLNPHDLVFSQKILSDVAVESQELPVVAKQGAGV